MDWFAKYQSVAAMRQFDLKPVLALLNGFTANVREAVLAMFAHMRTQASGTKRKWN
jgi:hypothetical protein